MASDLTAVRHWHEGLPPVTAQISCGSEQHRITWRRGKLVLEDHDVISERALVALGSEPPRCLEILDAWREMRGTEFVEELLVRHSTPSPEELAWRRRRLEDRRRELSQAPTRISPGPMPSLRRESSEMRRQREARAALMLERERRMWAISLIESLPPALRRALGLSVIVHVERHWHDPEYRIAHARRVESALTAIAVPLLEHSARHWRHLKPYTPCVVETWLPSPGEEPTCVAWADSAGAYAALSLPLSWFTEVWARGIALVDDCFVIAVDDARQEQSELRVLALRWERASRETSRSVPARACVSHAADGAWHLHWL